jgi:putative RNA 2'-phosphotransferase
LARALRHQPDEYGIQLDEAGWADLCQLARSLGKGNRQWAWLSHRDIHWLVATDPGARFECRDGRIRALYGHSVPGVRTGTTQPVPFILYHATDGHALGRILRDGLRPMGRHFVHLTSDRAYALAVGSHKFADWALLAVDVMAAIEAGCRFLRTNHHVWQTDSLHARFLRVLERHARPDDSLPTPTEVGPVQ